MVKSCTSPCVQDCYLRQESDSAKSLMNDAVRLVARRLKNRLARFNPKVRYFPATVLRMELSDVCPCGVPYCTTPAHRWERLTDGLPKSIDAREWARFRDQGRIDFGRGFMGFEVVRAIVDDLRSKRMRFGTLSVRWRGEPLLHPEVEPILRHLLNVIAEGDVADRLCIETDGRFLDERIAQLAAHPASQVWRIDATRGGATVAALARQALQIHRHDSVAIQTIFTVDDAFQMEDVTTMGLPIHAGKRPGSGDLVWIRRPHYDQFQADKAAHQALEKVAAALGVAVEPLEMPSALRGDAIRPSPTVSWDGKVTMRTWDHALEHVVGDVVHGLFSAAWTDVTASDTFANHATGEGAEAFEEGRIKSNVGNM